MKIKILLTLLIITLLAIAIISGCGGGSETTHLHVSIRKTQMNMFISLFL